MLYMLALHLRFRKGPGYDEQHTHPHVVNGWGLYVGSAIPFSSGCTLCYGFWF